VMRSWSAAALSASVVSTAELKAHLRVDGAEEDAGIGAIGLAACQYVEQWTQRLLTARTIVLRLSGLPHLAAPVELPGGVVTSITNVVVQGETLTGYTSVGDSPALLVPDAEWPSVTANGFPVTITYVAGYTTPPAPLVHAVKLIAAEMFDQRRQGTEKSMTVAPVSAEYLMSLYRIAPQ